MLSVIAASTPLLLAAAGELVTERSGVLNLGLEGMMIMGAACAFAGAYLSGSVVVGALCGVFAGTAMAAIFAIFTLGLAVNQVASGLALTILGTGLSGLIGAGFVGQRITPAPQLHLPALTDLPLVGRILFGQDAFVYLSVALVIGIWLFLYRSRAGLVLRAVGDNHTSAHALGYPVLKIRALAVLFGGGCAGLAGALSAACLYAVFHSGHDRGAGLDRTGAGGVRVLASRSFGGRRLLVRRGLHPAAPCPGSRPRHSFAVDVVAALSCHGHRSRVDFADARHFRVCRASISRCGLRAGPLIVSRTRATGASRVGKFEQAIRPSFQPGAKS